MAAGSDDDTRDDDDDDDDDEDDEEDDENSVAELQGLNLLREKPEDFVGSATIMAMHRMFQVGRLVSSWLHLHDPRGHAQVFRMNAPYLCETVRWPRMPWP
jgi:hypothetical protein